MHADGKSSLASVKNGIRERSIIYSLPFKTGLYQLAFCRISHHLADAQHALRLFTFRLFYVLAVSGMGDFLGGLKSDTDLGQLYTYLRLGKIRRYWRTCKGEPYATETAILTHQVPEM